VPHTHWTRRHAAKLAHIPLLPATKTPRNARMPFERLARCKRNAFHSAHPYAFTKSVGRIVHPRVSNGPAECTQAGRADCTAYHVPRFISQIAVSGVLTGFCKLVAKRALLQESGPTCISDTEIATVGDPGRKHTCAPLAPWTVPPCYRHGSLDHAGVIPDYLGISKGLRPAIDVTKQQQTLFEAYASQSSE
jgi:hypothetical protein